MNRSIEEILANARALRKSAPSKKTRPHNEAPYKPYVPPPMQQNTFKKLYEILAPVGFKWADYTYTVDHYLDEDDFWLYLDEDNVLYIKHGHARGFSCALPLQCHVTGWRPSEDAPEPFKISFYRKFKYGN